jgi:hypothetical protein
VSQILIGWSGRARHGKTECTKAVREFAEREGKTVGVYDVGAMILQTCVRQNRLPDVKRADMTKDQIQVLIDVGKELKNAFGQDYFAKRVVDKAKQDKVDVAMCPNLRLPVEADCFRKAGGVIVRVNSLNKDGSIYISPDRDPNDVTETALQFWPADYYLTVVDPVDARWIMLQAVTLYKYITGYTS